MTKTEILLYGALLESDMYADGYGSTDEDTELLQKALKKIYGVTEGASRDVLEKAEEKFMKHLERANCIADPNKIYVDLMSNIDIIGFPKTALNPYPYD